MTNEVRVPGRVYGLAFSPGVTGYLEMVGLEAPSPIKLGRGWQYVFYVDDAQRQDMLEWADTCAAPWRSERRNPDAASDARAIDQWLKRQGFTHKQFA